MEKYTNKWKDTTYSWIRIICIIKIAILPKKVYRFNSISQFKFSSVIQLCLTLCDPMDCNTPDFPVYEQLPELTQTHVHQVSDATQPSYPLSSPSPPTFNLSQHQGLFKLVSSSHQVAKVFKFQLLLYYYLFTFYR